MSDSHPELSAGKNLIVETLKNEEEKFSSLLDRGIKILNDNLGKVQNNILPGSIAFKLYDTYGFPLDLTADILRTKNIKVDSENFTKEMEASKKLARANWKGSGDKSVEKKWFVASEELNPTEFLGYEFDKAEGVVIKISKGKNFVDNANIGDEVEIVTNQTPFYAESGGQIGDQGIIYSNDLKIIITDTQKKMGDIHVHIGKIEKGSLKINQNVNLEINTSRRNNAKAYHSATHLLHEALRRTLGKHVIQKGSLVSFEKLRFDFSHNKPIEKKEIEKIEKYVNDIINTNTDVKIRTMTLKEAVDKGALAMFGEKYGEEVRVLSMGKENDNYFSIELCGGTHVKNTEDIGRFKIINQSSVASGIRRVEALRDNQLDDYEKSLKQNKNLKEKTLKGQIDLIKEKLSKYKIEPNYQDDLDPQVNIKNLNKQLEKIKIKNIINDKSKNIIKDKKISNFILRKQILIDLPPKELRKVVDDNKKEIKEGIVVSFSIFEGKIGVAVGITQELSKKYDAVILVKIASEVLGGQGGGGRKDFAQAGGIKKNKIDEAFLQLSNKIN
jgi:alanyl-tRNA synthetase